MIIEPKKISAAYRCASCGQTVFGIEGAISLGGDMIRLKCGCGESALEIKSTADGKARVKVPCVFCQTEHMFVVSKKLLASKELFTYPCPYTGIDICFFGTQNGVSNAVKSSDEELSELILSDDTEIYETEDENYPESDESVRDIIKFVLGDLREEKKIFCACGTADDLNVCDGDDFVEISCKRCGASRKFFCVDSIQTNELFDADELHLT